MSVVIDFVKNDSERETTGVFTFEGYPTSPLRLPRLTPLIKRPVPCVQAAPSLPTRSNAESSSDSNSKPSQPIPISIHDVFRMKACTELVPIERPTDKQDIPSSKRKNDESEEADSDAEVEHERCENCSTNFDPSSERLPHECSYHPGTSPALRFCVPSSLTHERSQGKN